VPTVNRELAKWKSENNYTDEVAKSISTSKKCGKKLMTRTKDDHSHAAPKLHTKTLIGEAERKGKIRTLHREK